jgi:hypothetical protein
MAIVPVSIILQTMDLEVTDPMRYFNLKDLSSLSHRTWAGKGASWEWAVRSSKK